MEHAHTNEYKIVSHSTHTYLDQWSLRFLWNSSRHAFLLLWIRLHVHVFMRVYVMCMYIWNERLCMLCVCIYMKWAHVYVMCAYVHTCMCVCMYVYVNIRPYIPSQSRIYLLACSSPLHHHHQTRAHSTFRINKKHMLTCIIQLLHSHLASAYRITHS